MRKYWDLFKGFSSRETQVVIEKLAYLWSKEPIAFIYVVGAGIWSAYVGFTDGLATQDIMRAMIVALGAALARMNVYSPKTVKELTEKD